MTFHWNYPVYVIPLGGGFASVVDPEDAASPTHALAVFTSSDNARHFMQVCGLPGAPRALTNAHQFAWLLQSLQHPVTHVAFDPAAEQKRVTAAWLVTAAELLTHPTVADRSPWNYPVFVVMHPTGFASIAGRADDGEELTAVCLFTERAKAEQYLNQSPATGEVFAIEDLTTILEFLHKISATASAVALDPTVEAGNHTAEYCVNITTLLEQVEPSDDGATE